ncbi:MAG: hypothetical protein IJC71_07565 [Clostridia bacterium]|nr:hypothetical protein [Clostridia bacterium]
MTKKILRILSALLVCLLLCSCVILNEKRIIGTWEGEDTLTELDGTPFAGVSRLVFSEDGSGLAYGQEEELSFTYALTDDTLTIRLTPDFGWGITYRIEGDTLTIRKDAVFAKVR